MDPCIGCDKCRRTGACAFADDMGELAPRLIEADTVVFAAPTYYYDINAQLKAVIDRFYAHDEHLHCGKKTAFLLTMADTTMRSAEGALLWLRNMAGFLDWEVAGEVVATNCWTLGMMQESDFPQQAFDLGRAL